MQKALIYTIENDIHASAVKWVAEKTGREVIVWEMTKYPMHKSLSTYIDNQKFNHKNNSDKYELNDYSIKSVWNRRAGKFSINTKLSEQDIKFSENECSRYLESLKKAWFQNAFWVNPISSREYIDNKIPQLLLADQVGLRIPATLCSNDPIEIKSFKEIHKEIIFKSFHSVAWRDLETMNYTVQVTDEMLIDGEKLRYSPGIFQEKIDKAYELRVVVIGHTVFAIKINSQDFQETLVDWRRGQMALSYKRVFLPNGIVGRCIKFMEKSGIVFGSFDFIVTKDEEYIFLEVNEQGQFLGYETPEAPLLHCFTDFLFEARSDFEWSEGPTVYTVKNFYNSNSILK